MGKRGLAVAAILLMTAIVAPKASANPYIYDAGSIAVTESRQEYLESSGYVLRYRFVAVDSELLLATLVSMSETGNTNSPATIELPMLDDVTLIASVVSYKNGRFKFFAKASGLTCESQVDGDGSNGSLEMTKLGHVTGRFWVCDHIYTIGPTPDLQLPYHIVSKLDPMNLPSID